MARLPIDAYPLWLQVYFNGKVKIIFGSKFGRKSKAYRELNDWLDRWLHAARRVFSATPGIDIQKTFSVASDFWRPDAQLRGAGRTVCERAAHERPLNTNVQIGPSNHNFSIALGC
ncbi:hypothetical protein AWB80_08291 [Caballeronia pedi]|uniref:Uncharacterized protein n=1 Tax=Caballeronia pedi TaxID=1777141 RepID=A0A158E5S0_9BURK|nr:hypothetical protein AWB80_08291 [Caballeronia pedi]